MQQKSIGNQVWRFAGPIVIQYLISLGVATCISAVFLSKRLPDILAASAQNADMTQMLNSVVSELAKYTTETTAISALVTIPFMLWMYQRDKKTAAKAGQNVAVHVGLPQYIYIIILGAGACMALNNLLTMGNLAFYSEAYQEVSEAFYSAKLIIQIIGLGILAPIAEELVFRGLLYKRMREHMTVARALVWSALVFGLYHANMVQAVYGFVLGLLLAYLYEVYGSLKAAIFGHIVLNVCSILFTYFKVFDWVFESPIRMGVVTVISAAIAAAGFVLIQRLRSVTVPETQEDENQ